jgi:transcriptional regulator with XRE-family HTH domain
MEEFNDLSKIHIGKRIKEVLKQKRISVNQLAKSISHSRCTVYDIFNRKSVDTELLIHISHALDYNFLREEY